MMHLLLTKIMPTKRLIPGMPEDAIEGVKYTLKGKMLSYLALCVRIVVSGPCWAVTKVGV